MTTMNANQPGTTRLHTVVQTDPSSGRLVTRRRSGQTTHFVIAVVGLVLVGSLEFLRSGMTMFWSDSSKSGNAVSVTNDTKPAPQPVPSPVAADVSNAANQSNSDQSSDWRNMHTKVEMLKRGRAFMQDVEGYSANMYRHELVDGKLVDPQTILIKCRQHPFSVYLSWIDGGEVGREVIFVEGRDRGRMTAHDGGWKARIPAFHLAPESQLAMWDSRYPVTNAGIMFLLNTMLGIHEHDLQLGNFGTCDKEEHADFDGRDCVKFTTRYSSRDMNATYRKSITWIDRESGLPLHTIHFHWPDQPVTSNDDSLDGDTLLEDYAFHDLDVHQHFKDATFDPANGDYNFH